MMTTDDQHLCRAADAIQQAYLRAAPDSKARALLDEAFSTVTRARALWKQALKELEASEWPPRTFDPTLKQPIFCEVCGAVTSSGERCTNGRCATCHRDHCTPGGITAPGHGRGTVATPFAATGPFPHQLRVIARHKYFGAGDRCELCREPRGHSLHVVQP